MTKENYQTYLNQEVKKLEKELSNKPLDSKEYLEDIIRIVSRTYQYDVIKAISYIKQGLDIAKKLNERELLYILKFHNGLIAFKKFDNNKALEIYFECLEYFKTKKGIFYYHTLNGLGEVFFHLREYKKSREVFLEVLNHFISINDEKMIISKTGQFVNLLYEMCLYEECEQYNDRLLELSEKYQSHTQLSFSYLIKARLFLAKKDVEKFEINISKSIEVAKKGYSPQYLNALCVKAEYLYSCRKYDEMKKIIDEILSQKMEEFTSGMDIQIYEMLYNYYEKNKKYKEANRILKLIFELKDNQSISKNMYLKIQELQSMDIEKVNLSSLYFYDTSDRLIRMEIDKIIEIDYQDRICTINQSFPNKIQKYSSFNEFIKLLNSHSESSNQFFKINSKNKAINLDFFYALDESKKIIQLRVHSDTISYPISVRQISEIKNLLPILN